MIVTLQGAALLALPPMVVLVVAVVVSRCSERVPDYWEAFRRQKRQDGEKVVRMTEWLRQSIEK